MEQSNNPYRALRRINVKNRPGPIKRLIHEDTEITSPEHITEVLNAHFVNSANFYPNHTPNLTDIKKNITAFSKERCSTFSVSEVSKETILNFINKMGNPAAGIDKFPTTALKKAKFELLAPLSHLVNLIIRTATYPKALKIARVVPIAREKKATSSSQFRPISVLPVINKIIKNCLISQINQYISKENILANEQFGFRAKRGCDHAIASTTEVLRRGLENKKQCAILFIDLSRAFDSVRHDIFLAKLEAIGLTDEAVKLLNSYLTDRQQAVILNTTTSTQAKVKLGLPQGSLIGPTGFALFINDLPNICEGKPTIYADDCSLVYTENSIEELERKITEDLKNITTWCQMNCLSINLKKTHIIHFKRPRQSDALISVNIDGKTITQSKETRFLGVILDDLLSGTQHTSALVSQINRNTSALRRFKEVVDSKTMKLLYNSMIVSLIQHGTIFWSLTKKSNLTRIEKALNRAARCAARTHQSSRAHQHF